MSLFVLPVTVDDILDLQDCIQFFTNEAQATSKAAAINAKTTTVYDYALQLLAANLATSQVAVAVPSIMLNETPTVGVIENVSLNFLPNQINFAISQGLDPVVYAAEAWAVNAANDSAADFAALYGALDDVQFAAVVSAATGVNTTAILSFISEWVKFYTANPQALPTDLDVQLASYAAAFGDAIGNALVDDSVFTEEVNAFAENALLTICTGQYVAGVVPGDIPQHTPLQGEPGNNPELTLTDEIDSPTEGFTIGTGGTITTPGGVFLAPPDTITVGDNLVDTVGDGTLGGPGPDDSAILTEFTSGFSFSGIQTANLFAPDPGFPDFAVGFQGTNESGLETVNNNGSLGRIRLGGPNQGLDTALQTYNSINALQGFTAVVAAAALTGVDNSIAANLTGDLGSEGDGTDSGPEGTAVRLVFAPDAGQNGYENWTIDSANNAFLVLGQGTGLDANGGFGAGFGSATNLLLTGTGKMELNALAEGDFAALEDIDATGLEGGVVLTGAASNTDGGYYTAVGIADDGDGDVSLAGLLTSGGGHTLAPTSILGSTTGANFVDLSGLTDANVNAMTDITGNLVARNTLVLSNSVVQQAGPLAGASGFQIIGDTELRAGTINMANFQDADTLALYGPEAINIGAVIVNNGTPEFTIDLRGNTGPIALGPVPIGFHNWVVNGGPGTTGTDETFNLVMGTKSHINAVGGAAALGGAGGNTLAATPEADTIGFFGLIGEGLVVKGYEEVNIDVTDGPALPAAISILTNLTNVPNIIFGGISMTPTAGGGNILNVTGTGDLIALINAGATEFANIVSSTNNFVINADLEGILAFGGTNALQVNGADSGGIIMVGGVDTNPAGATLTGSATGWNALAGSVSKDVFTGGTGQFSPLIALQGDVFGTNGGADLVNLAAGHTNNHIDVYGIDGSPDLSGPILNYDFVDGSITSDNTAGGAPFNGDLYQPGWAGVATGGTPQQFGVGGGEAGTPLFVDVLGFSGGTSASQVTINGFHVGPSIYDFVPGDPLPTGDVVEFAPAAWGTGSYTLNAAFGGTNGTVLGLVDTSGSAPSGTADFSNPVQGGQVVAAGSEVIVLSITMANANALAQYLHSAGGDITIAAGGVPAGVAAHTLWAYSDGANVHIADVEFVNITADAGPISTNDFEIISATDMVQLTGVASVGALDESNIHFVT